jgi:hypothetical protein
MDPARPTSNGPRPLANLPRELNEGIITASKPDMVLFDTIRDLQGSGRDMDAYKLLQNVHHQACLYTYN